MTCKKKCGLHLKQGSWYISDNSDNIVKDLSHYNRLGLKYHPWFRNSHCGQEGVGENSHLKYLILNSLPLRILFCYPLYPIRLLAASETFLVCCLYRLTKILLYLLPACLKRGNEWLLSPLLIEASLWWLYYHLGQPGHLCGEGSVTMVHIFILLKINFPCTYRIT